MSYGIMDTLEERLKFAREYAGLLQKELADKLGVNYRTILRYEQDASKISAQMVEKISELADVNLVWLISGKGELEADSMVVQEASPKYDTQDNKDNAIRNIIKNLMFIKSKKSSLLSNIENYVQGVSDSIK